MFRGVFVSFFSKQMTILRKEMWLTSSKIFKVDQKNEKFHVGEMCYDHTNASRELEL